MPFTAAQLVIGANYSLETYAKNTPVDQINVEHPFLKRMVEKKIPSSFGNGYFTQQIRTGNASNYQNYFGADQVTFNHRDTVRQAKYAYANHHEGFGIDEDELNANGISMSDDGDAKPTDAEAIQLTDILKENFDTMRFSIQEGLERELLLDGTQDAKAAVGIDHLISLTPTTGVVGGLDSATATYWRNAINLGIAAASLVDAMETTYREVTRYGGMPTAIFVGSTFLDTYRQQAGLTINREIQNGGNLKGGVSLDASVSGTFFKGLPLIWVPEFANLDTIYAPATPWEKRAYFINENHIKFRPVKGEWMKNRRPKRVYDRYVHYFGQTSKYALTTNKRRAHAVLSVA